MEATAGFSFCHMLEALGTPYAAQLAALLARGTGDVRRGGGSSRARYHGADRAPVGHDSAEIHSQWIAVPGKCGGAGRTLAA